MCDNIDALLADDGGIEGEYDIRAEDEEALLEEDNYDDQNLVSSSNRNYYVSREELEEEELDHEPEDPEDVLESDENVSELLDEDLNDSLNNSSNAREKRDTKFVSERILPNHLEDINKYIKPTHKSLINKDRQQNQQQNVAKKMQVSNRGIRGGRFRGRGRGNVGNRPDVAKKVLINPHFPGNTPFSNNQVRPSWHNSGRLPFYNQQRMPPPQHFQQNQPLQQQIRNPNNQFVQHQQQQMDFVEPNRMSFESPPQQLKTPVHQRLGNQSHVLAYQSPSEQPQQQQQHRPQFNYQSHHPVYTPPSPILTAPPPQQPQLQQQHAFMQPSQQYNLPPPPAINNSNNAFVVQQHSQPIQANYATDVPPPLQMHTAFAQPIQQGLGGQQLFNCPPPGYSVPYEQQSVQQNVFVGPQQHNNAGFEFQLPPHVQAHAYSHEAHFQQQQEQQQILYQHQMPPPNYEPPSNDYQLQNEQSVFNSNTAQYIQSAPPNTHLPQERRVFAPRPTAQNRLGPPPNNPQSKQFPRQNQQDRGRFVVNRGGGNSGSRGGGYVGSQAKRRFNNSSDGCAVDQRRRRTAEVSNLQEVPTVDSTTNVYSRLNSATPAIPTVITSTPEIEEDDETRLYRQKIENQKRIREKILTQKEERRKQAARRTAAEKDLANLTPPAEIAAELLPEKPSPIKTIISQANANKSVLTNNQRCITNSNLTNRIVSQQPTIVGNKDEISSFLTNRRIIAKDQSLPDTSIVIVSNLAAGTSEVKLRKLCQGVGDIQVSISNDSNASGVKLAVNCAVAVPLVNYIDMDECSSSASDEVRSLESCVLLVEPKIETIKVED